MGGTRVSEVQLPEYLNVASYFLDENLSQGRGGRVAIYSKNESFTYSDLCDLTNRVGNVFRELGVEVENRVCLALQDSVEFVVSWYAAVKIGAVATQTYTYFSVDDYEYEIDYLKPKAMVVDNSCIDRVREAISQCRYPPKALLLLGVPSSNFKKGEYDFYTMIKHADRHLEAEPTHKDDIALWKFSGGTTGHRKAAPMPHKYPVFSFESFQQIMQYTEDDIVLSVPKMFFGYGRDGTMVFPFRVGAAAVLYPERATAKRVFELVERYKPSILVQVPTMMRKMLETPKGDRADLSCIRLCTSAGEALSAELYHEWRNNFGCEVINFLGSAEMYYGYISNRPGEVIPGSLGKELPGYSARIVDDDGIELPDGEVGVLMAKGPTAGFYYVHDLEKSKKTFRGDWVYTDDLFKRDAKGYYWFCGRKDELLKVSGYFVSPLEIEECIQTHPDVVDCAVVGVKDSDGLDKAKAFVILRDGVAATKEKADEVQKFPKQKLSPYKFPRYLEFVEDLPKTAVGKVDRQQLKKRGL